MSYHRHAENVVSKVDIACGQFVLYHVISCYIPAVMGHPKNASGCHCVLSLCNLMYCHLPNIIKYLTIAFEKIHKSQSHLQQIQPISFILPRLCAYGALKVIKQL